MFTLLVATTGWFLAPALGQSPFLVAGFLAALALLVWWAGSPRQGSDPNSTSPLRSGSSLPAGAAAAPGAALVRAQALTGSIPAHLAPTPSRATSRHARPVRHTGALRGWKLGVLFLSEDRTRACIAGLTRGADLPYDAHAQARCAHDDTHEPPVRGCECGFHAYLDEHGVWNLWVRDARARKATLLDVEISGRFIRYERGIRFSTQKITRLRPGPCPGLHARVLDRCDQPSEVLVYDPLDLEGGWVRLRRRCGGCVPQGWGVVGFAEYAHLLGLPEGALTGTDGNPGLAAEELAVLRELVAAHSGWSAENPPLSPDWGEYDDFSA